MITVLPATYSATVQIGEFTVLLNDGRLLAKKIEEGNGQSKRWQESLDEGDYASALGIAQGIGLQMAEVARVAGAAIILDVYGVPILATQLVSEGVKAGNALERVVANWDAVDAVGVAARRQGFLDLVDASVLGESRRGWE